MNTAMSEQDDGFGSGHDHEVEPPTGPPGRARLLDRRRWVLIGLGIGAAAVAVAVATGVAPAGSSESTATATATATPTAPPPAATTSAAPATEQPPEPTVSAAEDAQARRELAEVAIEYVLTVRDARGAGLWVLSGGARDGEAHPAPDVLDALIQGLTANYG
jgi:hypothetical protein